MVDIVLEIVRAVILLGIVLFLLKTGRSKARLSGKGWNLIVGGFALLLFASLLDITDNFESLNRYVVIGDTQVEAFLEKMVGFLGGFILLALGLVRWIPSVQRLSEEVAQRKQAESGLRAAHDTLEPRVKERTSELDKENADRKRAEETLRASEARLAGILDIAPEAVISVDQDQRIRLFNKGAETIFGCAANEVLGRPLDMLLPARLRNVHGRHVEDFARSSKTTLIMGERGDVVGLRKDGSEFPAEVSISKLQQGGNTLFTVMLHDVSERKRTEEQLRQAQKMEAVGQLTGGVAHDFNNLLAIIMGNAELLSMKFGEDDPKIQAVIRAATRGAELTQRLLAFSRKQTLQPQAVDANALVGGMIDLLGRTLGETIEIKTSSALGLWRAKVDPGQLENALLNLAINARDAMPEGGTLVIEAGNASLDEAYPRNYADVTPGDYVSLAVSDSGSGMSPEVLGHALEPFFTTKEVGEGSGLGLSMVYGFAKQSGGHVAIYSEEGHGTTVKLYLPRTGADAAQASEEAASEAPRARGETVLVVEDESEVRAFAEAVLGSLGYQVLAAKDGREGLEILENEPKIDLLLSDVVLPRGMSGPDLAKEAKRRVAELNVLFMSGHAESMDHNHSPLPQDVHLLNKPFRRLELAQMVRASLDR